MGEIGKIPQVAMNYTLLTVFKVHNPPTKILLTAGHTTPGDLGAKGRVGVHRT